MFLSKERNQIVLRVMLLKCLSLMIRMLPYKRTFFNEGIYFDNGVFSHKMKLNKNYNNINGNCCIFDN